MSQLWTKLAGRIYVWSRKCKANTVKTLEGVRQNSTNKQDNVLLEYHFFCHLCIFHVDKPRYECALLKNKSPQKTFVLPVFVGSVKTTQATNLALSNSSSQQQQQGPNQHHFEFERFSIGKQAPFPSGCHVRDSDSQKIIDKLHSEVPTPCNWLSSVSATMAEVFKLQGIHMAERGTKKEMDEVVDVLLKILDKPQII